MLVSRLRLKAQLSRYGIYFSANSLITGDQFISRIDDEFIGKSKGVLHVGAHLGQERQRYFNIGTKVLWVEAIPSVYEKLKTNISEFSNQSAINALLGDQNNVTVEFNLSSNELASSSIFRFGRELGIRKIKMKSQIFLPMNLKLLVRNNLRYFLSHQEQDSHHHYRRQFEEV